MQIIVDWDHSVKSAPAAFKAAVDYVVNLYNQTFTNAASITIHVGWGEVDHQHLSVSDLGSSIQNFTDQSFSYGQIRDAMIATADATGNAELESAANTISATDYTNGGNWEMSAAEGLALGLIPSYSGPEGYVGFSKAKWYYGDTGKPGKHKESFVGTAEHEISEVMGRVSAEGTADESTNNWTALDMFRYTQSGARAVSAGGDDSVSYFSIDGGQTDLGSFNNQVSNGDLADWYPNGPGGVGDAFNDYGSNGVANVLSADDILLMNVLGWAGPSSPGASLSSAAHSNADLIAVNSAHRGSTVAG